MAYVIVDSQKKIPNKSKAANRRTKLLIRQPRVKKDSESIPTPTDEEPGTSRKSPALSRQRSEPLPPKNTQPEVSVFRKQTSHPSPGHTVKVTGTITPILLCNIQSPSQETHSDSPQTGRADREIITCESDLPPTTTTNDVQLDFRETPEIYDSLRASHCPAIRSGPALSCNFCWNTVDDHGRVLRRKTKYHCPECQANLCIVPCFHEYHERNNRH